MERKTKPNWWIPFSCVPLMIVAILLESRLQYAVEIHEIVDSGIVILAFSLMVGWVRVNAAALEAEESAKERWIFMEEPGNTETSEFELPEESISEPTHVPSVQHIHSGAGLRNSNIDPSKGRYN